MLWINIKQNKVIERNISGERSSKNTQLSRERKEGLIVFSPLQFIALPPGTLRGVCLWLWSHGPVPLLLRHCGDWVVIDSVSSTQKCSGAGRLATPLGVSRAARLSVSCQSSVSGHRASRSKYTRGQSRETGFLSRSPGGVGAPAKRVSLGPVWADSGSLVFLKDDMGLRIVVSNRRLLRQSWCHGPGLMRAGPSQL